MPMTTSYANLVPSCQACMIHEWLNALINSGTSKYLRGLVCTKADMNLGYITISHFQVLNIQNSNKNMPNMTPIAYLNKTFTSCTEKLAWGRQEPHIHPYMFWYKTKGENAVKTSLYIIFMV